MLTITPRVFPCGEGKPAFTCEGQYFLLQLTAAGRRVLDLLERRWMTEVTKDMAAVSGNQFTVRGFHGDYEVHVYRQGQELTQLAQNFTLEKGSDTNITITLP